MTDSGSGGVTRVRIDIHPLAPPKPAEGQPCNGCGVCCLVEPCPVGCLVDLRRHGACTLLVWDRPSGRYRCATLCGSPSSDRWRPRWLRSLWRRLAGRLIAAGRGCDCSYETERA